jgi:D-alanine-D-alanine ligase-like ATP-grasp enzyme
MHHTLSNKSVLVASGGPKSDSRQISLRSGASVYHGLRADTDTRNLHIQPTGEFAHKGKAVDKQGILQSGAVIFNALQDQAAADFSRLCGTYSTAHTGNRHVHHAHHKTAHSRRRHFRARGIGTIPHWKLTDDGSTADRKLQSGIRREINYPVIVFPLPGEYSSEAVIAETEHELKDIVKQVLQTQKHVYVQAATSGRIYSGLGLPEFRSRRPYVFPPVERRYDGRIANLFSADKSGSSRRRSTGTGGTDVHGRIAAAYRAADFECLARIDLLRTSSGEWYLLDVDTHPRLDRHSLLADSAERVGVLLKDVYRKQVELARR